MSLLTAALASPHCILSVMGDHAGEKSFDIFHRKTADTDRVGKTFWLIRSPKARPEQVKKLCGSDGSYVMFIEPAAKGGARPTTTEDIAMKYSEDSKVWQSLPEGLSPVTGRLDRNSFALVFDKIELCNSEQLDLWNYSDFSDMNSSVKFIIGSSTICASRSNTKSQQQRMKSRYREIIAVARLVEPYGVYIK